ncbi:unnamed protein product [Kuraishia capsulata CBS 1993]|uniref:Uncharacterized protein n=1 Tax=Kuraishia capsulata CBS 1993 TaxID=1382522 RepID=W6MWT9_9ASCO|nr:uncharacterized protein KUCA_T00003829001 [Kuraishia capsulata CBS 1993]CDK27850.1 unnamed protein product [Kuraishia capsulata CBS 1993]
MDSSDYTESGEPSLSDVAASVAESDVAVADAEGLRERNVKYVRNANFNAEVDKGEESPFIDSSRNSVGESLVPEALRAEHWSFREPEAHDEAGEQARWLFSENLGTVVESPDKLTVPAWKRYAEAVKKRDSFGENTFKRHPMGRKPNESAVSHNSTASSVPSSPLKVFDKLDTYTTNRFDRLLGGLSANEKVVQEDDDRWKNNANDIFDNLKKLGPPLEVGDDSGENSASYTSEGEPNAEHPDYSSDFEVAEKVPGSFSSDGTTMESQDARPMSVLQEEEDEDLSIQTVDSVSERISTPFVSKKQDIAKGREKKPAEIIPKTLNFIPKKEFEIAPKHMNFISKADFDNWGTNAPTAVPTLDADDENLAAVDAISDLNSDSDKENTGVLSRNNFAGKPKREVSFVLDDTHTFSRSELRLADVTSVTQAGDISYSVTHGKWTRILTEVKPSGDWNKITECDLSARNLTLMKDLYKFAPNLKRIDISKNQVKFVEGIPETTVSLNVSSNLVGDLASFKPYGNLRELNLAGNLLDSLHGLSKLANLDKLDVSGNRIRSLVGLEELSNLFILNLSNNRLEGELDLRKFDLPRLKILDVSGNRLTEIRGIEKLVDLVTLKADNNRISAVRCDGKSSLNHLALSENRLAELDLSNLTNLEILDVDGNGIRQVFGDAPLKVISARSIHNSQSLFDYATVESLDLSGTKVDFSKLRYTMLHLRDLNLSAMGLEQIPQNFSKIFPNLERLNLNFNRLNDLAALGKLRYLQKVELVSNDVADLAQIVNGLVGSRRNLRWLDTRLNPFNRGFYPFVFDEEETETERQKEDGSFIHLETLDDIRAFSHIYTSATTEGQENWVSRDEKHVSQLVEHSAELHERRVSALSIIIAFLKRIEYLDGHSVDGEDRLLAGNKVQKLIG